MAGSCADSPAECMLLPGFEQWCGATEHAEAWTVTSTTCQQVPDGDYLAAGREGRSERSGWEACEMGSYAASAGSSIETTEWVWVHNVMAECEDAVTECHGLPFSIVDADHPAQDPSCDYQCTAGAPDGSGTATASCDGPDDESCTFDYRWSGDAT